MSRTHIHTYQTRYHAQASYSKAIRARGDLVFMQGQVGTLLDGTLIGEGDPGAQDVCKLTVYVTDISYRPAVYEAINRWFEGVQHCSTGVVVQGLADPSLLVEIDAMAVIDD